MEPDQIDWKRIDSYFVEDVFYEHFRAPKWFDFLAPTHLDSVNDDDAWFCKPDCNHPKRPEDFLLTPTSSKHQPLKDANESPEATSVKKSNKEALRVKCTQYARNLFSERDILGHVSGFCYELKRLATKVTEREDASKPEVKSSHHQVGGIINQSYSDHDLELKKERKPLLEVRKDKLHESMDVIGSNVKENRRRKKRVDDAENIPVSLNVETLKNKGGEGGIRKKRSEDEENNPIHRNLENVKSKRLLQQIRTNPPSPQSFSEKRTASLKPLRAKPTEMVKRKEKEAEVEKNIRNGESKEARGLDVLCFLKSCTMTN